MHSGDETGTVSKSEKDKYRIPTWVGKPPEGSHLDVMKSGQVVKKLIVDEKGYYYFGRNPIECDFVVEHASCSRVHGVLLYHRLLKKFAIVDLQSSHGTTVGMTRIEQLTPIFIDTDATFCFGASTRRYALRAKPLHERGIIATGKGRENADVDYYSSLHNLPEKQAEIDNMTEYNTAQNRRIQQIPITPEEARKKSRKRPKVCFKDEEEIVNPEDVDPTVGRFRNLVRTAVIPTTSSSNKRTRVSTDDPTLFEFYSAADRVARRPLRREEDEGLGDANKLTRAADGDTAFHHYSSVTPISLNAAPNLELYAPKEKIHALPLATYKDNRGVIAEEEDTTSVGPHGKKKYAKEAWPGRKPNQGAPAVKKSS